MWVGTLQLNMQLPGCQSRKEKRSIVRSLVESSRARFNVACAEVGHLDRHDSTQIGVAAVANQRAFVQQVLEKVEAAMLARQPEVEIGSRECEIYSL